MNDDEREKALAAWCELFMAPETRMNAAGRYEELVRMADKPHRQDLITTEEKNALIRGGATEHYASAVEGLGS